MVNTLDVTEATFKSQVLDSPIVTIVDLWAHWCEPCRRLAPVLDEVAAAYPDRLRVVKVDVEANPGLPGQYGVMSLPTLLVFREGRVLESIVGYLPKDRLLHKLAPHLR